MKIIYMGTPDFAVLPLKSLLDAKYDVVAVVTMPDKPAGRGQKLRFSPVKEFAIANDLKLLQPTNLKDSEFLNELKELNADLQIVVAFRMLPEEVWNMPPLGTINLHTSLLPQYRGAAPINWAIINGDRETGVTLFRLKQEIDTGDILLQESMPIEETDNVGSLYEKMLEIGSRLIVSGVEAISQGALKPIPQVDRGDLRPAPKIFKETCRLDFGRSGVELHNLVRGLSPYPAAWFSYKDMIVKVYETLFEPTTHQYRVGKLLSDGKTFVKVAVADGFLHLKNLQLSGKKRMEVRELLLGFKF